MNISVTLGPISEREHFRNFKAYPGNISTPYFFFGALCARRGVPQYEAPLGGSARRRTAASAVPQHPGAHRGRGSHQPLPNTGCKLEADGRHGARGGVGGGAHRRTYRRHTVADRGCMGPLRITGYSVEIHGRLPDKAGYRKCASKVCAGRCCVEHMDMLTSHCSSAPNLSYLICCVSSRLFT